MTQPQREALIDLLVLSIFMDSHLSLKEDDALHAALDSLGWEALKPREIFFCSSMSRARKASDSDATLSAYLEQRAGVFGDPTSQATALDLLQRVLAGDGVAPAEAAFLERLRGAFH